MLIAIVGWTCFVIWYKVRKVNETSFPSVVTVSIVGITTLVWMIMDAVTIGLPIDVFFKTLINYLSMIFFILLLAYLLVRLNRIREKKYIMSQSPDLKKVFYSIEDLAIILDDQGEVVEINHPKRYQALFGTAAHIDKILNRIVKNLEEDDFLCSKENLIKVGEREPVKVKIRVSEKVFLVSFSSIVNKGIFIGNTMVVYDITNQKQVEEALVDQIAYMEMANKKLRDSVAIMNSLESEKIRLELVDQVQKDLIIKLEKIVKQVHNIQKTSFDTTQDYHKAIHEVADFSRGIYKDVRDSIKELFSDQKGVL